MVEQDFEGLMKLFIPAWSLQCTYYSKRYFAYKEDLLRSWVGNNFDFLLVQGMVSASLAPDAPGSFGMTLSNLAHN